MARKEWWLVLVFWLMGCAPQPAALPTRMAAAPLLVFSTATAVSSPTLLPTHTPHTAVSAQPAPSTTPIATETATAVPPAPTATATPAPPTPTPTPIPPAEDSACRAAALLAPVKPQWVVKPGPWPRPAAASGLLGRARDDGLLLLHLGFDVEGDPSFIGALLDVLEQRQVKTTMFILGSWADTYPEWVQEMARRGHEMASHGYTHQDMSGLTAGQIRWELRQTETAVHDLTGQSTQPWLRPPFGAYGETSLETAYAAGYTTVIWSGSSNDWRSGMDADKMCETLRHYTAPGAILYAHTNRAAIVAAVDRYIAETQLKGYTFVPLSVLMADDPAVWLEPNSP